MRRSCPVLIETYWNVNEDIHYLIDNDLIVLIETYWNVNILITRKTIFQEKY